MISGDHAGGDFVDVRISENDDTPAQTEFNVVDNQHMNNMYSNDTQKGNGDDDMTLLDIELTQKDINIYANSPQMIPMNSNAFNDTGAGGARHTTSGNDFVTPFSVNEMSIPTDRSSSSSERRPPQSLMAPDNNNDSDENQDANTSAANSPKSLNNEDLNIIQQLDEEYEKTLIEREIGWNARYISVRQNAGLSLWFMFLFLTVGTIFFDYKTSWTLGESLLFSIYTITTVGYGRHEFPREPGVLFFISIYIFLGIATLTIMAAQLYQWVVLELTWARYEHDKQLFTKRHERNVQVTSEIEGHVHHGPMMDLSESGEVKTKKSCAASTLDYAVVIVNKVQNFVKDYPYGQIIGMFLFLPLIICICRDVLNLKAKLTFHTYLIFCDMVFSLLVLSSVF